VTGRFWTSLRLSTARPGPKRRSTTICSAASVHDRAPWAPWLPLIGRADWNDCLNLNCFSSTPGQSFQTTTNKDGKVAESVFIAGLFVYAGRELAAIASRLGLHGEAASYLDDVAKMEQAVSEHGWDGEWFLRAYDDFGAKIGSKECEEGKIFIESNGFCVLAGIGLDDGKAAKALAATREHLATKHGIVVQQPAYSRYYLNLGEISSYPPDTRRTPAFSATSIRGS